MENIFVLVTILGHLPVILFAKRKGSEDMKQILIVEDDSFLNKMLAYNLTADGYGVTSALNARTAAEAIRQREFDLVLLDINLPDGNGFELCKLIKPQHPDTIVIFLTANDQESDQIRGYEVGAVDYITKPFVIGALQRKIKAMFAMLEHHIPAKDIYDVGRLFLDFSELTASLNDTPLTLSPMEYKMLNLFRKNPRQVLTRGTLYERYGKREISREEYIEFREELQKKEDFIKSEIQEQEMRLAEVETELPAELPDTHIIWKECKINELNQEVVDTFIKKINVWDEQHMEIIWNFSDGKE